MAALHLQQGTFAALKGGAAGRGIAEPVQGLERAELGTHDRAFYDEKFLAARMTARRAAAVPP